MFICCSFSHSKDVRLPVQLQRVMAAEAEATREARAKVKKKIHLNEIKIYSSCMKLSQLTVRYFLSEVC